MRSRYKQLLKDFLADRIKQYRKGHGLTQENMAERLRVSPRSYIDLEHKRYGCSSMTVLFFFLHLNQEELLQLLRDFRALIERTDYHDDAA